MDPPVISGTWEAVVEIACGILLCLVSPIRTNWKRTFAALQFAIAGFALGYCSLLVVTHTHRCVELLH
jgi:hypothetical protein